MRPLIPRVQVGSILYGTKNLRNWLRKASLLTCLEDIRRGLKPDRAKKLIFAPQKNDEYIVAVNAWGRFAVWSPRRDIVLLFINPEPDSRATRRNASVEDPDKRMDPSIFPSWFINTNGRRVDLRQWPNYAYHLWASLHMNAISGLTSKARLIPNFDADSSTLAPFQYHEQNSQWDRYDTQLRLLEGLKRGMTRRKWAGRRGQPSVSNLGRRGITLSDLDRLDERIRQLASDPRFCKKIGVTVNIAAGGFEAAALNILVAPGE